MTVKQRIEEMIFKVPSSSRIPRLLFQLSEARGHVCLGDLRVPLLTPHWIQCLGRVFVVTQSLSCVQIYITAWATASQALLSMGITGTQKTLLEWENNSIRERIIHDPVLYPLTVAKQHIIDHKGFAETKACDWRFVNVSEYWNVSSHLGHKRYRLLWWLRQ